MNVRTPQLYAAACLAALLALPLPGLSAAEEKKPAPAAPAAPETVEIYRLKAGDEISVTVTPQSKYDCAGVVLPDGKLFLKNVGEIRAVGMTLDQVQKHVFKYLDEKVGLREPTVVVTVTKVAPLPTPPEPEPVKMIKVTVVGAVLKPGPLDVEEGTAVRKAIDIAGGAAKEAVLNEILIIHADKTKSIIDLASEDRLSDPAHNRVLKDGDSIDIKFLIPKAADSVEILGAITKPNRYELKPEMTLKQLIMAAEGMHPLANVEKIQIQRKGETIREVNLLEQEKLGLKGEVPLQPNDRVYIPQHENTVLLVGAVNSPGPVPVQKGMTIKDFFLKNGQTASTALDERQANLNAAQLIRQGQETVKLNLREALKKGDSKSNVALEPGDTIYLPARKMEKQGSPLGGIPYIGALLSLFRLF